MATNLVTGFMNYWTVRNDSDMIKERSKVGEGAKSWDKIILGISGLLYLFSVVLAGLDSGRFHWSPNFHWSILTTGVILTFVGQIIFLIARKENRYFSSIVRIQSDRDHKVCDTGIYKIIRHPGYLGMSISLLAFPLITASVWCFIPIGISLILLILRTYLEDKTLKNELLGYNDYMKRTKSRIIPGIW